jgi:hypothetical protein
MPAECMGCSLMAGRKIWFQKCDDCGAVFCPDCNGQKSEPYHCPKCRSNKVGRFPGTMGDLLDLM